MNRRQFLKRSSALAVLPAVGMASQKQDPEPQIVKHDSNPEYVIKTMSVQEYESCWSNGNSMISGSLVEHDNTIYMLTD